MPSKRDLQQTNFWREYHDTLENFASFAPRLFRASQDEEQPFRGLTIFTGDTGNIVVGIRTYSSDGAAQVAWTSGDDLVLAFMALEKLLHKPKWRADKR